MSFSLKVLVAVVSFCAGTAVGGDLLPKSMEARTLNGNAIALVGKGKIDEAIGLFGRSLKLDPINPTALGNLASIFARKNELDKAYAFYLRGSMQEPALRTSSLADQLAQSLTADGINKLKKNDFRACVRRADQAMGLTSHFQPQTLKAECLLAGRSPLPALEIYDSLVKSYPKEPEFLYRRAGVLQYLGRCAEMKADLGKFTALNPAAAKSASGWACPGKNLCLPAEGCDGTPKPG